jgi:hypothetical protein
MEIIKTFQYHTRQPSFISELTFKSDCTEIKHIAKDRCYGQITTIQTYFPQDPSKEQKLIFPTRFIKFFKLLSSSDDGQRFWFQGGGCNSSAFEYAGIDTDIYSGDSTKDFMRYIYRDMVVPFTELEKENNHLREQLERKDQELKEKDRELAQMKEQLKEKDRELNNTQEELYTYQELKNSLLTKDEELETKDQYFEVMQQELKETKQELKDTKEELKETQEQLKDTEQELKETQEQLKDTEQELKDTKEEVRTRGILLKSCVDDLKTCAEEIENVEKKNQKLEHLNLRLICETSSSFIDRTSYFTSEM